MGNIIVMIINDSDTVVAPCPNPIPITESVKNYTVVTVSFSKNVANLIDLALWTPSVQTSTMVSSNGHLLQNLKRERAGKCRNPSFRLPSCFSSSENEESPSKYPIQIFRHSWQILLLKDSWSRFRSDSLSFWIKNEPFD